MTWTYIVCFGVRVIRYTKKQKRWGGLVLHYTEPRRLRVRDEVWEVWRVGRVNLSMDTKGEGVEIMGLCYGDQNRYQWVHGLIQNGWNLVKFCCDWPWARGRQATNWIMGERICYDLTGKRQKISSETGMVCLPKLLPSVSERDQLFKCVKWALVGRGGSDLCQNCHGLLTHIT